MIITQPLHSFAKLSRLKCRHTMLSKLQCQSNHGENRARTPRLLWNMDSICRALPISPIKRSTNAARHATSSNAPERLLCVERLAENPNPKRSLFKSRNDSSICIRRAYTATTASALKCARPGHTADNHCSRCASAFFKPRVERIRLPRRLFLWRFWLACLISTRRQGTG